MHLYKYLIPDRVDVLTNKSIRFTQAAEFNDPFEVAPHVAALLPADQTESFLRSQVDAQQTVNEVLAEKIDKLPARFRSAARKHLRKTISLDKVIAEAKTMLPAIATAYKPTFAAYFQERSGERIGILSLSEKCIDLLMWAHYGDHHRGFVIEFDCTNEFFTRAHARGAMGQIMKVLYSKQRPAIIAFDPSVGREVYLQRLIRDLLLTKGIDWSYENEWRMILPLDDMNTYPHRIVGRFHLFDVPHTAITAVIIGARATDETKSGIRAALSAASELHHVVVRQAKASDTEYGIVIRG